MREYGKKYYTENKVRINRRVNANYHLNAEQRSAQIKLRRKNNKEAWRTYLNAYKKTKRLTDPLWCLKEDMRKTVRRGIEVKSKSTVEIIGCSYETLLSHLESTWERNYPGQLLDWKQVHIDHVVPLASAKTEEEVYKLHHFSNLQLLTAVDNIRKSDNYEQ
jgi:hypothetical protein